MNYFLKKFKIIIENLPYSERRYLYRLHETIAKYTVPSQHINQPIYFILGSQRSGTTLLGLILDSHSDITVYDENVSYKMIHQRNFSGSGPMALKIPILTRRYEVLNKMFPEAKYIFMQRDIRSVVSSMLKLKVNDGRSWAETHSIREIEKSLISIKSKKNRDYLYKKHIKFIKNEDIVSTTILCAYLKKYLIVELRDEGLDVFECQYEKLVNNPEKIINEILLFLDLPWDSRVLEHHKLHKGIAIGDTNRKRSIDALSLNKWKEHLTDQEIEKIEIFKKSCPKNFKDVF